MGASTNGFIALRSDPSDQSEAQVDGYEVINWATIDESYRGLVPL